MEKILIVDGNNLLFQMFYGIPTKIYNKSNNTIHATIGFISAIQRMIKLVCANKAVVVFDEDCSEQRKNEYEDYKSNRICNWDQMPSDEVPFNEEKYICDCLNFLKITYLKSKNMEADDLIASLALSYGKENCVYIASNDSDFYQLINQNVSILKYKGKNSKIIDNTEFYNMFGFQSNQYVFYKSLVGDNADNIKGISQIGKKRASDIVRKCKDFEELLLKANEILSSKIATIVSLEKEKYYLNSRLITLLYKEEVNFSIELFSFDNEKINLKNSEILSFCNVFE